MIHWDLNGFHGIVWNCTTNHCQQKVISPINSFHLRMVYTTHCHIADSLRQLKSLKLVARNRPKGSCSQQQERDIKHQCPPHMFGMFPTTLPLSFSKSIPPMQENAQGIAATDEDIETKIKLVAIQLQGFTNAPLTANDLELYIPWSRYMVWSSIAWISL